MTILKSLTVLAAIFFIASLMGATSAQRTTDDGQNRLTAQERRGKQIYLKGESASGRQIMAYIGQAGLEEKSLPFEVPASTLTCAGCHGLDGQGKPEGGVVPSNITWEALTKSYGVTHASGRKHPPYTERALELAIRKGIDPAGNRLAAAMPTYDLSSEEMADLIAYLKRVGKDLDPGLTETSIKIGTSVPDEGPMAESGQVAEAVLAAYFEEVNRKGGIYNRKIELAVTRSHATAPAENKKEIFISSVERLIHSEQVFALAGAFIAGADKEIAALTESEEVPLIAPFTLMPQAGFPLNRQVFYLFSGLADQSRALVKFASDRKGVTGSIAIVFPESRAAEEIISAIESQAKRAGLGAKRFELKVADPSLTVGALKRERFEGARRKKEIFMAEDLKRSGESAVFFLGSGAEACALMKEAERLDWHPDIFIPGSLAGRSVFDAPASFKGKVFLSFPTSPSDQTREGLMELSRLAAKHKIPAKHLAAQVSAYSAARILVEGLRLAGRDLSREKLITALEGLYELETGLTARITFGPNRRVGALGAYVVTIDPEKKQLLPASGWVMVY
ncbi:MAG: ABC transporter substrate-binding protein [Blastocatellia bacterium]|nr:ABC transporter substrate-binding protein [Blastocatellia bacterium]